jgi:hypothetical protein
MSSDEQFEKLMRKYYGYVADLEGAGVEILEMLFVRDHIQEILEQSSPRTAFPQRLYNQVYQLDDILWQQKNIFLQVVGERELRHARLKRQSPRSHWWWYLDQLELAPRSVEEPDRRLVYAFAPTAG